MISGRRLFGDARAVAAWTALVAAVSLVGWAMLEEFARRSVNPVVRGSWLIASLLAAVGAGVLAFPRWQAIVGIGVAALAIVLLLR